MAKRRRTRISYAPKSRRKSSASNKTLTTSSINEQEKEQETVKPKSKQKKSRIVYKPKVYRRKTSAASTASENVSSNEQDAKELPRRNKRRSSGTLMAANKQQLKKKKENLSSSEENSLQKASTSGQGKGKQKTTPKKGVTQRKKRVEEANKTPKHIKDITIGRKTYAKWRLLNPVTKMFTEQALESAMLNVLNSVGRESKKKVEVQVHLKKLTERISSRLDILKGPPHKEDYRTMEAENRELENAVISCNGQIEVLEKELEEQNRLLEEDTCLLNNYSEQQIQLQWHKELHPLLQKEPVNALKLPSLSDETSKMLFTSQITTSSEKDNKDIVSLVFGEDKRNKLATANG